MLHVQVAHLFSDIIHTVGPMNENSLKLRKCYERCLEEVLKHNIRSVVSDDDTLH